MKQNKEILEKYLNIVENMNIISANDRQYNQAKKIASTVQLMYPNNNYVEEWNESLDMYTEYTTKRDKIEAMKNFVRFAKNDLKSLVNNFDK